MRRLTVLFLMFFASCPVLADEADVVAVVPARESDGTWRFSVTVRHADTGWEHYADRWDIRAPDGRMLDARVLLHPHVEEQPFTRALGGVVIADDVKWVTVRAHCSVDGYGGQEMRVELER